ncbi:hypothetical protein LI951_14000 [Enterococcus sp. BWT-B8]|uniref:hypothetical protein n=1 Tax=Enterococcus sp. BWT-B8 TaxID=2885157 RepID=UPI001E56D02B|nr:hypothetical protein [Enterococcus sp. BWT-B8]MCB5953185.1 hypothetical protein [Enterococcus sp. BWT-B8]
MQMTVFVCEIFISRNDRIYVLVSEKRKDRTGKNFRSIKGDSGISRCFTRIVATDLTRFSNGIGQLLFTAELLVVCWPNA